MTPMRFLKLAIIILLVPALLACSGNEAGRGGDEPEQVAANVVRGIWIPDPTHTAMLQSREAMKTGVALMADCGINTIFVCAYARTQAAWPSRVYAEASAQSDLSATNLFAPYLVAGYGSADADPIDELIVEADQLGIRVVLWFEYGFMASNGPTPTSHPLLAAHPEWQGIASDGTPANYNGSDYYLNAYRPEVQQFLLDLIDEGLTRYPHAAGVQVDDRAPAMPRNSGYDDWTKARYASEHNGELPPSNPQDEAWTAWRLELLNSFARSLHARVKAHGSNYLLCFAPNPYPWCRDNLMQDSRTWLREGLVDLLSTQCYRYTSDAYRSTVEAEVAHVEASGAKRSVLNPGIILKAGSRLQPDSVLNAQLRINRLLGTNGESHFYNEGLADPAIRQALKEAYN